MRIKDITLRNIRSYTDETITFPEGTVLLSGDIGSGKSSILLAIEFALFGIRRGTLTGTDLLRHGETKGSVELTINVDGTDVTIHRELKRSNDTVGQEPGYIVMNGKKFEGTPVELKAKVINLLGYPQELVSKSKSLIYRYTVYTPQERMKQIIYDDSEDRLDTLRKVFNIDKYKRVKENAALVRRELKSQRDVLQAKTDNLDDVRSKLEEQQDKIESLTEQKEELQNKIDKRKEEVEQARERLETLEEQAEEEQEKAKRLESIQSTTEAYEQRLQTVQDDIQTVQDELKGFDEDAQLNMEDIESKLRAAKQRKEELDETLSQIQEKQAKRQQERDDARETIEEISELDKCPLCKQDVTEEHVEDVRKEQLSIIQDAKERLDKAAEMKQAVEQQKQQVEKKLSVLRERKEEAAAQAEQRKRLEEKQERLNELQEERDDLQSKLKELREEKEALGEVDDSVLDRLDDAREEYEQVKDSLQDAEVELAGVKQDIANVREGIEETEERIDEMEAAAEEADEVLERIDWLNDYFIPTMEEMERHVMHRVYDEFNEYFSEWFDLLIDDSTLRARLDDSYAPVVVQDGYTTSVENLSGGERTSLALAYRLALNKVVNDFHGAIRTRDVIILDEPTDGFSTEQLDTVRDVLEALDISQIIVVSHEAKMETYVDDIINVVKRNNESHVETA